MNDLVVKIAIFQVVIEIDHDVYRIQADNF